MRYEIKSDERSWPSSSLPKKKEYFLTEIDDRIGLVNLYFEYHGNHSGFKYEYSIIPLFLSEMMDFLESIDRFHRAEWVMGFSTFAFGEMRSDGLYISSRSGEYFDKNIYDYTAVEDLKSIRSSLKMDIWRYGQIKKN